MAEQGIESKKAGWIKAFIGTLTGLVSGAAVMYITPLVNRAIQPAKPVANFKVEHDGYTVRIQNLSNVAQGNWDFGDGSALQPVASETEFITHQYPGPGSYTIKLSVNNILNDENDRSVVVNIDGEPAAAHTPKITDFELVPLSAGNIAPASFRLSCNMTNAQMCVLDTGDGRLKIVRDMNLKHLHSITFSKAGHYVVKMLAINGTEHEMKSAALDVVDSPTGPGVAKAVVSVIDVGKQLQKQIVTPPPMRAFFPQHQAEDVFKFETQARASLGGYTIADVCIALPGGKELRMGNNTEITLDGAMIGQPAARNLRLTLSPDRQMLKLAGELVRENSAAPPRLALSVQLNEQREVDAGPTEVQLTRALGVPGSTFPSTDAIALPPVPADWTNTDRQVRVELDDGTVVRINTAQLPVTNPVMVQGRAVIFSATRVNDQVNVSLTSPTAAVPGVGGH